jgi:hypothetical protein
VKGAKNQPWYLLEMLQFCSKTLELKFHNIQWKARGPVNPQKVGNYQAHAKFPLTNVMEMTLRITTILSKQSIKSLVECLMGIVLFGEIHNKCNFVILGSLWHRFRQESREGADFLESSIDETVVDVAIGGQS